MKRRKVMRLLAVAMAASLAVTSQGIPSGLTTVYASGTVQAGTIGASGHLYEIVTPQEHDHTGECYESGDVLATSGEYFKEIQEDAYNALVAAGDKTENVDYVKIEGTGTKYYEKITDGYVTPATTDLPEYTIPSGKHILEDVSGGTYSLHDAATADETHEIEVARANPSGTTAGSVVVYLTDENRKSIKGAYASDTASTTESGNTILNTDTALSSDYYTIKKYVKADPDKADTAKTLPGAIEITSSNASNTSEYTKDLGFGETLTPGEVYIPLEVLKYTVTSANANDEVKITPTNGTEITWKAVDDSGIVWVNATTSSATQPSACYTLNEEHTKYVLQVATAATHKSTVDSNDYYYQKASVENGAVKFTDTKISDLSKVIKVTENQGEQNETTNYYIDVTGEFVTGIAVTKASEKQYVTATTKEEELDDGVTLTFGKDSTTTQTVDKKYVTSEYTKGTDYGTGDSANVNITGITTDYLYAYDTNENGVIDTTDTSEVHLVSSIKDFTEAELKKIGITGNGSYIVNTVTAPSLTLSTDTSITNVSAQTDRKDGNTVYEYSGTYPTVTKPETSDSTDDWTFLWVDEILNEQETATTTTKSNGGTAQDYSTLADYSSINEVGHHKVYLEAYYKDAKTPSKTYDAIDFYVIKENPTTIEYSANQTYNNGSEIAAPTESSAPNPNAKVDYSYFVTATGNINETTSGLPTAPGSYTVVATYEEDLVKGLKETQKTATVTVDKATGTASTDTIPVAKSKTTEETQTVKLGSILSGYAGGTFSKVTLTSNDTDNIKSESIDFNGTTNELTFTLESGAAVEESTITAKLENTNYTVTVTVTLDIKAAGTVIKDLSDLPAIVIYYNDYPDTDNDGWDALLKENIYKDESEKSNYTIGFGSKEGATKPTAVGTTKVYVTYTKTDDETTTYGSGSTTIEIKKKPLTITATAQTINVGGEFTTPYGYTVKQDSGKEVTALPSGLTANAKVCTYGTTSETTVDTASAGTYTLTFEVDGTGISNYDIKVDPATLTVQGSTPYTPPAGTDETPSTTTEPTLTTNEDGDKVIVDADGKVIADELVTIDGKSYVTDENGEVLTSQIAEVGDVKVYVGKNGVVATDKAVTYEGKKYYATETGEIATNSFVTTARGNKVYATKSGALKTSTAFTVAGKKYYAKASGVIATTGFVKTAKGNTVYATKSGALKVNTAFKASNGKKYVADKNGKIVKGKKITIGNKVYTTNKKGVIVKVTTKKK